MSDITQAATPAAIAPAVASVSANASVTPAAKPARKLALTSRAKMPKQAASTKLAGNGKLATKLAASAKPANASAKPAAKPLAKLSGKTRIVNVSLTKAQRSVMRRFYATHKLHHEHGSTWHGVALPIELATLIKLHG